MKFTLSQLKYFLDTDANAKEVGEACTSIGLELEDIHNPAESLAPFTIARVLEAKQHPNADRLRVCMVETGLGNGEPVQVVCGAPNARTGMYGVFAPAGTRIPGTGLDLKPGVIRGEASNGMLCSERELTLSDEHDGIVDIDPDAIGDTPLGTPYAAWAGLDDPVIEVGVTPNRPDALGVYGIARDLAAKGLGVLKPLDTSPVPGQYDSPIAVNLEFDDPDNAPCPFFVGRMIRNVENGQSPAWMQRRLRALGLRPISALVDITNYITIAFGRPLHVFDADKVAGPITARLARDGESLMALDGKEYTLDPTITVIADENGAEGIGGIIGGEETSVTPETRNVFLEAAWFDPIRTATSGRKLGILSDARFRFERGVDPAFVEPGAEIATRMILDICGGEPSHLVKAGAAPIRELRYTLHHDRVRTLLGIDIPRAKQVEILDALGFSSREDGDNLSVLAPTWRPDIDGEADLIEEIIRIYGLDHIGHELLPRLEAVTSRKTTRQQNRRFRSVRALADRGLMEAVTWSFLSRPVAELFEGGKPELELANPISSELSDMRPSLLPNLIAAARKNVARGAADFGLCEVGQIYLGDQPDEERLNAAGVRFGRTGPRHWGGEQRNVDAFDAKADALAALIAAGAPAGNIQAVSGGPSWYHPGRVGTLQLGPKLQLARFGEVHPHILEAMDMDGPLVAFEVDLDAIPAPRKARIAKPALNASDLQPVKRDFAFVVGSEIGADVIMRAARGAEKTLIEDVAVFDVFEGPSIGEGLKSVAIEVTMQPRGETMTDAEIDAVSASIVASVEKSSGGQLRG